MVLQFSASLTAKVSDSTAACMVLAIIIGCHCSSDQEKSNIYLLGINGEGGGFFESGPSPALLNRLI